MSRSFDIPPLTPQFCFNQTALRDFLRLARNSTDDSITQHLNALAQPATKPWDPNSTSTRQTVPPNRSRQIDPSACTTFTSHLLFPAWQMRSDILTYCASVATSPDPEDPDSLFRAVESERARERVVDERLDPYSGRYFPREARTEALASLVRSERMVEEIVRRRTWGIVGERCPQLMDQGWERALDEWRRDRDEERESKR